MLSSVKIDRNVIHISSHSPFSWNRLSLFQEAYSFFFSLNFFAVCAVSDRISESDIIFFFFVYCHFSWFLISVSGQLSTTFSEGAQGICHFTCGYNVSLLAVVHHSLWLGSDRSSRSDIFLFVCLQVTSLAQGICHFTCIFFKFSLWAVVHHSLWGALTGAQGVTFVSLLMSICPWLFIFSLWAVVHHSLWGVDRYNPFRSRLSGSPWTV